MKEPTEVINIRIPTADKIILAEIAEQESRTLAAQIRLVVREWIRRARQEAV